MLKSEKKAINRTRMRYMLITSSLFLVILILAIFSIDSYYKERRKIGGYIEINQKVPELVKNDFNDDDITGFSTQEKMFIVTFDDEKNYRVWWNGGDYLEFINENYNKIYNKTTFIDEFLIGTVKVNNTVYYCGFDQSGTLASDIDDLNKYITIMSVVYVSIVTILYFTSYIMLKPLKQNLKMQNEFISNASHNLKTPIAVIKANTELLKEKGDDSKELQLINRETQYMNLLIEDLLILDKISSNKIVSELYDVNLSKIVNSIALSFDAIAYEKEIDFSYDIKDNVIYKINVKDFKTLLNQLVSNAFKYVENEKIIKIKLYLEKGKPVLEVYNTGCRINEKDKNNMFQRFYRDKSAYDNSSIKGSGLGLAIVKAIADRYKYTIKVDVNTGKDILFKILL